MTERDTGRSGRSKATDIEGKKKHYSEEKTAARFGAAVFF
ncbi:MAG: hypothetical protein K0Q77_586 [Anaerosporomusa subterranea]|nr:hypothetical protein [Anaerosporomusa subterranea]